MRVDTERGFVERLWPERVDRLHADPRWLRANANRPGRDVHTVRVSDGFGAVSALAYVHRTAGASEAYDLHGLLLGDPPVFQWSAEGEKRLRALLEGGGNLPAALLPAVTVVLPGYDAGWVAGGRWTAAHLNAMIGAVAALAAENAATTCAFLYVPREDGELTAALRRASFLPVALTARACLPVRWSTLSGYTDSFSRHRRHKLRNELVRLRRLGVRSWRADPRRSLDTMVRLRCAHVRKFGREPDEGAERRRLAQVLDNFPERDFGLVLTGRGDLAASCALFLRHGVQLHLVLAATDPAAELPYAHYESAFYAPIRLGLTPAGAEVDYGISHLEHKVLRGCVAAPLDAWVRVAGERAGGTLRSLSELSLAHRVEAMPTLTSPLDIVRAAGVDFVTGVPDSELATLVAELERGPELGQTGVSYLPATREDNAVALAAGATLGGATALVFMKSMGLGTAVDAITSLVKVYELPLVLYVSWVGYRGRDVPHHNVLGEVLEPTLAGLGIPSVRHTIGRPAEMLAAVRRAVALARRGPGPVAVLAVPAQLREAAGDAP